MCNLFLSLETAVPIAAFDHWFLRVGGWGMGEGGWSGAVGAAGLAGDMRSLAAGRACARDRARIAHESRTRPGILKACGSQLASLSDGSAPPCTAPQPFFFRCGTAREAEARIFKMQQ